MNANNTNNANNDNQERNQSYLHSVVNNGGFNLNPDDGCEGRYTRSHYFQNMDEWDMVFSHIIAVPPAVHETSMFVHDRAMRAIISQRRYEHDTFPEVVLIPLPCSLPNFKRCILHVEECDRATNSLTGRFTPIHVTYHANHPIAQGVMRLFHVEAHAPPRFQKNEDLVLATIRDRTAIEVMCRCLVQPVNNFDAYDALADPNEYENLLPNAGSRHILPDPRAQEQANAAVLSMMPVDQRDLTLMESCEQKRQWSAIVYPRMTANDRRNAYVRYAAEQINIHRYLRILWGNNHPDIPNPIDLPANIQFEFDHDHDQQRRPQEHVCENNPADRNHPVRGEYEIMVNSVIQVLYNSQNNLERARIAAMEVRL